MTIDASHFNADLYDILDFVKERLRSSRSCDSKTLIHDLAAIGKEVSRDFLDSLLWTTKHNNIDFDPSRSSNDNMMWEWRESE